MKLSKNVGGLYLPLVVKDSVSGITAAVVKGAQLNDI
jgi:hypothetical protein